MSDGYKSKYLSSLQKQMELHSEIQNQKTAINHYKDKISQLLDIIKDKNRIIEEIKTYNLCLEDSGVSPVISAEYFNSLSKDHQNSPSKPKSEPKPQEPQIIHEIYKPSFPTYTPATNYSPSIHKISHENSDSISTERSDDGKTLDDGIIKSIDKTQLISWNEIMKLYRPSGTLSVLNKKHKEIINDSVKDYLKGKVIPSLINDCYVTVERTQKGTTISNTYTAIPNHMVEDFNNWLDKRFEEGMLEKRKQKRTLNTKNNSKKLTPWDEIVSTSDVNAISEDREYKRRVMNGIMAFLKSFSEIKASDCKLNYKEGSKIVEVVSIPDHLSNEFKDWFENHKLNMFYDFDEASILVEKKKRKHTELEVKYESQDESELEFNSSVSSGTSSP